MSDNIYHDHLDVCEKCRNNPMDMCVLGGQFLAIQAEISARFMQERHGISLGQKPRVRHVLEDLVETVGHETLARHHHAEVARRKRDVLGAITDNPEEADILETMLADIPGHLQSFFQPLRS